MSSILLSGPPPPVECDGYSPVLVPQNIQEVSFYISAVSSSSSLATNKSHTLACSLIHNSNTKPSHPPTQSVVDIPGIGPLDTYKPIIIICHGLLSWRNQMLLYHLAASLTTNSGCHALRFDFTGNGQSTGGTWEYSNYQIERDNLKCVVEFAQKELHCRVSCILGHSKGALAILNHAWEQEQEQDDDIGPNYIPCFVNLSGRYLPEPSTLHAVIERFTPTQQGQLQTQGSFLWTKRGNKSFVVTKHAMEERAKLETRTAALGIKKAWVLTIHGDKDDIVPVESAYEFEKVIKNHELFVVKGADHNFNGLKYIKRISEAIVDFLKRHDT